MGLFIMQVNKPTIPAPDYVDAMQSIVENGKNGFISENDEYSFKTCIESVFANENTYKNMAQICLRV